MREPNDLKLAQNTPPGLIDLILGGHDHFYAHHLVKKTHILRSGTDFKQLSYIEVRRSQDSGNPGWDMDVTRRDIVRDIEEDPTTVQLIGKLTSSLKSKLEKPVGYNAVPLDARFTTVRTRESNLGNFVCDLMRFHYGADCAIMAGGTIRGDQIYPPGVLRLKDVLNCFPFEDPVIVIKVTGKQIWDALENGVSLLPALEGRFPQVGGMRFGFNATRESGNRILWAEIGELPLNTEKMYTLATRGYMGRGKDGFDCLLVKSEGGDVEEIVSEENGMLISMILRQYAMSLKVFGRWRRWGSALHNHWDGVHQGMKEGGSIRDPSFGKSTESKKHDSHKHRQNGNMKNINGEMVDSDTDDDEDHAPTLSPGERDAEIDRHIIRTVTRKWMRLAGIKHEFISMVDDDEEEFLPHWTKGIAPKYVKPGIIGSVPAD